MLEQTALEAAGISKRYGAREALRRVDLVARPGRLHGLLGPNGAGKTTLMRVLLGLVTRDAGTVRVLGRTVDSTAGPVPDGVAGFVETPAVYPYFSGRQNLALLARLDGDKAPRQGDSIGQILEQVGLAAQADDAVSSYSAGMRQRVGLAAALLRSPRSLLLDEPTNFLDPAGGRDVRALLRRLADQGVAVVLSSHDMSEVEELCADLTILHLGQVIFSGTADQLRALALATVHELHTSDDHAALDLAARQPGVKVAADGKGSGLEVVADVAALDAYVVALGRAGIAVRSLVRRARSFESLFLELTGQGTRSARLDEPIERQSPAVTS